jgi:hypothetical protein
MSRYRTWMDIEDIFADHSDTFHVEIDNDWFCIYPEGPPDQSNFHEMNESEQEQFNQQWEKWRETGVSMYASPENLLVYLVEKMGGTISRV